MTGILGLLGLKDTDNSYLNAIGQAGVYTALQTWSARINMDMEQAMGVFVSGMTENYKERYYLPGGGRLQERGEFSRTGAVRATGSWDVAYPLHDFGAQVVASDVAWAKMTAQQLVRHTDTVRNQYAATVRFQIMRRILNNTALSFADPEYGTLTCPPLASGDGTLYPPVVGSETEADDTHHLESGYAASAISDTNNPLITIRDEIAEHFGESTGGDNVVVFISNNAERAKIEALTEFVPVEDQFIRSGGNADVPTRLPSIPGTIIGRAHGVWVSVWRWLPSAYMIGVHLEAEAPLKMRVDPAASGLPRGLALVSQFADTSFPMVGAEWRTRFGVGVANRLNAVVMELGSGGSYSIPTGYTF